MTLLTLFYNLYVNYLNYMFEATHLSCIWAAVTMTSKSRLHQTSHISCYTELQTHVTWLIYNTDIKRKSISRTQVISLNKMWIANFHSPAFFFNSASFTLSLSFSPNFWCELWGIRLILPNIIAPKYVTS